MEVLSAVGIQVKLEHNVSRNATKARLSVVDIHNHYSVTKDSLTLSIKISSLQM